MQHGHCSALIQPVEQPLHLVKKKDGSWRPCGDFRRLNLDTKADKYQVPNLADFSSHLEGCTVFSTLDLKNGYLQVALEPSAVPKTAVITPFGLFEFLRIPFGLKNAGMTFQCFMHWLFNGLDFVFIYIDNILIASKSRQDSGGSLSTLCCRPGPKKSPSALLHAPPWNSSAIRCLPSALGHYLAKWRLSACTPNHPTSRSCRVS